MSQPLKHRDHYIVSSIGGERFQKGFETLAEVGAWIAGNTDDVHNLISEQAIGLCLVFVKSKEHNTPIDEASLPINIKPRPRKYTKHDPT